MPYRGKKRKKTRTQKPEEATKEKVPQSIVARKGSVGPYVADLVKNFRNIMEPHTASHLSERTSNSVKDYINIAGPYGVSHIILFNKSKNLPRMRIGCFPQGPTLHFRIEEYTLSRDILKLHGKGIDVTSPYFTSPVLVLNNFPENDKPLQLVMKTFQNMFPAIDPEKTKIDDCRRALLLQYDKASECIFLRHYSIVRSVTGVSKAVSVMVNKKRIPNLSDLHDISEYIINNPEEEMEFEEESTISNATLTSMGGSHARPKQAVKLVELGPRMCMRLMLVESGLYSGEFLFNKQTKDEEKDVLKQRHVEKELQAAEVKQAMKEEKEKEEEEKEYRKEMSEFNKERDRRKKQKKEEREKKENAQKEKEKEKKEKVKGKVFHKKAKK